MKSILCTMALVLAPFAGIAPLASTPEETPQAAAGAVPAGELALGSVTLGRRVLADGKPLEAGTYRLRLTANAVTPVARGQTPEFERWVEFLKGGTVVGREVVSIVPGSEIREVAQGTLPAPGSARVELLKGADYLRIWVNRGGNHYLIHLPTSS